MLCLLPFLIFKRIKFAYSVIIRHTASVECVITPIYFFLPLRIDLVSCVDYDFLDHGFLNKLVAEDVAQVNVLTIEVGRYSMFVAFVGEDVGRN
jgi:hypothetical protein